MIATAGGQDLLVLVIAADRDFADRCRQELEAKGHRASVATGWWVGVHLAAAERPDLVIVDEALADVDGLSVLAILKAHPSTSRLPVVVAASKLRTDLQARAERLGALAIALKSELTAVRLIDYLPDDSRFRRAPAEDHPDLSWSAVSRPRRRPSQARGDAPGVRAQATLQYSQPPRLTGPSTVSRAHEAQKAIT